MRPSPSVIVVKRLIDIVIGLAGTGAFVFFYPILAVMIKLESAGPVLYSQERVGINKRSRKRGGEPDPEEALPIRKSDVGGKPFEIYKFRSMRTDAELGGVAVWASKNDDRVTRVGKIIRRTRLDELPQLWNVLRGDMSVIGPRPERPQFVADLADKIRYYNLRHCVKPGLAGWAQLRYPYGASIEDAEEKLKYDLFYVKNNNLLFDFLILIQTFEVVLFGRGVR